MKKSFVLVLAIALLSFAGFAFAESTEKEPILFRDNKWGASLPEVLKSFPAELKFDNLRSDSAYRVEYSLYEEGRDYYNGHVVGNVSARSSSLKNFKVAGYEVTGIRLRFAWVPGEDGLIVEDETNTALYYAMYEITPKDLKTVYEDLVKKLSSIYGDSAFIKTDNLVINYKYTVWQGGDGTLVSLVSKEYSTGSNYIEIRYGTLKGNSLLDAAQNALALKETLDAATSTDGL